MQADSTTVAPKVSGYLREVLIADNQAVKAGQVLATIDNRDYVTALDQAEADVATAQADIENTNASLNQQQATIDQAQATVAVDQANFTFADQENARYGDLAKRGSGSVQMAQQSISRLDTARAMLARDTAAVAAAQRQTGVLQAQLARAQAGLLHSQAVQQQAQLNLDYTKIVAPIDGVVGNRTLRVGQFVQAGTQLMAVVPLASTYVVANFEETQLAAIAPGQPVGIAVDTFSGATVKGKVDSIAPSSGQVFALLPPDNATGNFTKIVQQNPGQDRDRSAGRHARATAARHVRHRNHRHQSCGLVSDAHHCIELSAACEGVHMTALAAPANPFDRSDRASLTTWAAVLGSLVGAFMAVLNIQITNASLLYIEGGIGTGVDNGAWISTAYLIGEIIVIPMTDYLSRVFSFRRFLIANTILFLVFSVACAFARDLGQMIVLRGFQGFTGGVLIPMSFTLVLTRLPKPQQPLGLALFALTATFAPAIGPTIGGYLTEAYGWQYIFFVNLVPGAIMVVVLWLTLEREPMQLRLLGDGDWLGIATMAVGLAALQTVLDEGNKDGWFDSTLIVRLSVIAGVFLALFVWIELTTAKPTVNLRLLARRNFGLGTATNFIVGFALYGAVYILPQYLGQVFGYNAEQIGFVLAWTGLPQLVIIPFVPLIMIRVDARLIVMAGLSVFAVSCFMNAYLSPDYAGDQLWLPNIVRSIGQAVILTPLSGIAMVGIARQDSAAASGLFNMLRNLGGAFGTALLATLVTKREQFHSNVIGSSVNLFRESVRERVTELTNYFMSHGVTDLATAQHKAIVAIGNLVHRQSLIMAYADTFAALGVLLLLAAGFLLLTKRPASSGAPPAH